MKLGIVGLQNVGESKLFNSITIESALIAINTI